MVVVVAQVVTARVVRARVTRVVMARVTRVVMALVGVLGAVLQWLWWWHR